MFNVSDVGRLLRDGAMVGGIVGIMVLFGEVVFAGNGVSVMRSGMAERPEIGCQTVLNPENAPISMKTIAPVTVASAIVGGSAEEEYALAFEKTVGIITDKDDEGAVKLLRQCANRSYEGCRLPAKIIQREKHFQRRAISALGIRYIYGQGVPKDPDRGRRLLEEAEFFGDSQAMRVLAEFNRKGTFEWWGWPNHEKAKKRLMRAIELGDDFARRDLVLMEEREQGFGALDRERAFQDYEWAAKSGDERVKIDQAICYAMGIGVRQNKAKAKRYFWEGLERARNSRPNSTTLLEGFSEEQVLKYLRSIDRKEESKDSAVQSLVKEFVMAKLEK